MGAVSSATLWQGAGGLALKLAVAGVGLLTIYLLYRPIRSVGQIMIAMWVGMLITVAAVVVTGAMHFNPKLAFDFPPGAWKLTPNFWLGLGAASAIGMYDYLGYYNICHLGDEVREPGRTIPRSVLISLIAVALLYVGINFAIIGVVPWREFVPPPGTPLADPPPPVVSMMMEKIWGHDVANVFTVMVLMTALASCVCAAARLLAHPVRSGTRREIFSTVLRGCIRRARFRMSPHRRRPARWRSRFSLLGHRDRAC
jgi:amino acid transporter